MEMCLESNKDTECDANPWTLPIKWINLEGEWLVPRRGAPVLLLLLTTIIISPDCEAHLSLQWSAPLRPSPTQRCVSATVSGPDRVLVRDRGAVSRPIYMWKPPPSPGCKGPNLEWQSSARDSWSTKEAWLSSSSQSPAAPLTHSTSIQLTHTHTHWCVDVSKVRRMLSFYSLAYSLFCWNEKFKE